MIRILVMHSDERQDIDPETIDPSTLELLRRVGSLTPESYVFSLTYKEKISLLLYLVDLLHDLDRFRLFLNKRLEDKSSLFKQKNDLHAEIKKIDQEKAELQVDFTKNQDKEEQDKIEKEIDELNEKLLNASRTESRWINQRMIDLNK
jgi:predicted  nucleic acid-binding Zn-ribbon protein